MRQCGKMARGSLCSTYGRLPAKPAMLGLWDGPGTALPRYHLVGSDMLHVFGTRPLSSAPWAAVSRYGVASCIAAGFVMCAPLPQLQNFPIQFPRVLCVDCWQPGKMAVWQSAILILTILPFATY